MNFRVTLGLLVVLVLLGGGVYWSEMRSVPMPTPTPTGTKIFDFQVNDVTDLAVTWAGKPVAVRKESDGQWKLTQPEAAGADGLRVMNVLSDLGTTSSSRDVIVKPEDLGGYGLAEPQGAITVTLTSGDRQRLLIGSANPDNSAYYTRRPTSDGDVTVRIAPSSAILGLRQMVEQPPKAPPTPTAQPSPPAPVPSPTP